MSILAIRKTLLNVIPFRSTILKATTRSFEIFNLGIWRPAGRIHRCTARENSMQQIFGVRFFFQVMPGRYLFCPKKRSNSSRKDVSVSISGRWEFDFVCSHSRSSVVVSHPSPKHYPSGKAESLDSYAVLLGRGLEQSRCEYPDENCFKLTASPLTFYCFTEYKVPKFPSN